MALAKQERNKRFIEDWKGLKLSNEELGIKYNLSITGVKSLKGRLRRKDRSLYEKGSVTTEMSPRSQVSKETATRQPVSEESEKMSFWLTKDIKKKLKLMALEQGRTASDILREILRKVL